MGERSRHHIQPARALHLVGEELPASASASAELRFELVAEPESVPAVRRVACGVANAVGMPEERLEDLKLAVTEAAANVAVHAYRDDPRPGMVELTVSSNGGWLVVLVCDRGSGPQPRLDSSGLGLGIGLMSALADGCRIGHRRGGGTEVELRFAVRDAGPRGISA